MFPPRPASGDTIYVMYVYGYVTITVRPCWPASTRPTCYRYTKPPNQREGWRHRVKDVKNSRRLLMMMMMVVLVVGADASVTQPQCQMTQGRTNSR